MPESTTPPPPRRVYGDEPARPWRLYAILGAVGALALALLIVVSSPEPVDDEEELVVPPPSEAMQGVLLSSVMEGLERIEEFNGEQVLIQTLERLNQWLRGQQFPATWQPDPLLATLPPAWRELPMVKTLDQPRFVAFDANHLQEVVVLRALAKVARGEELDSLARASRLFDWVVRNVQLEPAHEPGVPYPLHLARQVAVFGRGTVEDRAWLFVLLCRQQRLEVVLLALPPANPGLGPRLWALGVVDNDRIYLFEPRLGLPIPGPGGQGVATLSQLRADETLLRQLDVEGEPYPVTAAEVAQCGAWLEASPGYLCERMAMVESKLSGDDRLVLTTAPSQVADRVKKLEGIGWAGIWPWPYEQLARAVDPAYQDVTLREALRYRIDLLPVRPLDFRTPVAALQRGRVYHLKGVYLSDDNGPSANALYQLARPTTVDIELAPLPADQKAAVLLAKQDATFWLGLVAFERGEYQTCIDFLLARTLETWPEGPWTAGARYNLGRAYEALGQLDQAVAWYRTDNSPQRPGSLLRASRLRGNPAVPAASPAPGPDPAAPSEAVAPAPADALPADRGSSEEVSPSEPAAAEPGAQPPG